MAFYMPFDMINDQGQLALNASILSSTRWANIAKHALEALRGEMDIMQMQLQEVTLKLDALCEELATCQTKCLGLKQNIAT
jgi:hypothetical protein